LAADASLIAALLLICRSPLQPKRTKAMISFTPDDLKRFLSEDGKPIIMLNLLRFKPEG
jgi:hypothetical protein